MPSQRRGRACIPCATLKIKCQLGSDVESEPPCERCSRLHKDCILSQPQRQSDRVKELESRVASLTRLLQAHGIDHVACADAVEQETSPQTDCDFLPQKKRRHVPDTPVASVLGGTSRLAVTDKGEALFDLARLDGAVSLETQQQIVDRYLTEIVPRFPMVPINGDTNINGLRRDRTILLLAIIWTGSIGVLTQDQQDVVAELLLQCLVKYMKSSEGRNLTLLQSTLIASLWFRAPKHHKTLNSTQLTKFASALAADVGVGGPLSTHDVECHTEGKYLRYGAVPCFSKICMS